MSLAIKLGNLSEPQCFTVIGCPNDTFKLCQLKQLFVFVSPWELLVSCGYGRLDEPYIIDFDTLLQRCDEELKRKNSVNCNSQITLWLKDALMEFRSTRTWNGLEQNVECDEIKCEQGSSGLADGYEHEKQRQRNQ
ncbi:hypothetical protein ACOME3_006192 [Neoechinorhynchus agilis]